MVGVVCGCVRAGELGEQVRAAMLTENGETRFRERGGNCVLLRDDGLCPLQAAYGAEMLCRTCFTHPRFTEEYGQTAELTLSASCPEAARLLLEHDAPAPGRTERWEYVLMAHRVGVRE